MALLPWQSTWAEKATVLTSSFVKQAALSEKHPALLIKALKHARSITLQPLLLRLDGGHDSIENIDVILEHNQSNENLTRVNCFIK